MTPRNAALVRQGLLIEIKEPRGKILQRVCSKGHKKHWEACKIHGSKLTNLVAFFWLTSGDVNGDRP